MAHYRTSRQVTSRCFFEGQDLVDLTVYGDTRVSTWSFVKHHTQQISKMAVQLDAQNIRAKLAQITSLKQKAVDVANAAASATAA